jgi:hypothetical protein
MLLRVVTLGQMYYVVASHVIDIDLFLDFLCARGRDAHGEQQSRKTGGE